MEPENQANADQDVGQHPRGGLNRVLTVMLIPVKPPLEPLTHSHLRVTRRDVLPLDNRRSLGIKPRLRRSFDFERFGVFLAVAVDIACAPTQPGVVSRALLLNSRAVSLAHTLKPEVFNPRPAVAFRL
jgi:hypothetical protein